MDRRRRVNVRSQLIVHVCRQTELTRVGAFAAGLPAGPAAADAARRGASVLRRVHIVLCGCSVLKATQSAKSSAPTSAPPACACVRAWKTIV